jgi:hypothetical protein
LFSCHFMILSKGLKMFKQILFLLCFCILTSCTMSQTQKVSQFRSSYPPGGPTASNPSSLNPSILSVSGGIEISFSLPSVLASSYTLWLGTSSDSLSNYSTYSTWSSGSGNGTFTVTTPTAPAFTDGTTYYFDITNTYLSSGASYTSYIYDFNYVQNPVIASIYPSGSRSLILNKMPPLTRP